MEKNEAKLHLYKKETKGLIVHKIELIFNLIINYQ